MLILGSQNNKLPVTVLTLVTLLNIMLVIGFLTDIVGGSGLNIASTGLYVLATIELAVIIGVCWGSKRRNTTAHF